MPWLAPFLLISTGIRTLLAMLFGAYLDKRELQNAFGDDVVRAQVGPDGGLWLDYVADLGDGFNATYSVAYLLAQPRADGRTGTGCPAAQTLVMGGDQVYPSAAYDGVRGPVQGPVPGRAAGGRRREQPTLFAVPGNHDWYDGLTAFLRLFVRSRDRQLRRLGAPGSPARTSRWSCRPAGGCSASTTSPASYLDDPQLAYFDEVARAARPGDRVILAAPAPTWVKAVDHPTAYDSIDYFIRTIIAPDRGAGAADALRRPAPLRPLRRPGPAADHLRRRRRVPLPHAPAARSASRCRRGTRWPARPAAPSRTTWWPATRTRPRSRRYGWGIFRRLPLRNPGFTTLLGTLHTLLMLAMAGVAANRATAPTSGCSASRWW